MVWAAHWFQSAYRGGMRRWEDLGLALGLPLDAQLGGKLTRDGLQLWRRPVVKGENLHLWLRTLAVEGGFPVGILHDAESWGALYLGRVVATLLPHPDPDLEVAIAAAERQSGFIAATAYRQPLFYAIAGSLALAVVKLRDEVESDPQSRGIPASAWLDARRPGWRDELPIAAGEGAAAHLVDGLMRTEAFVATSGSVGCERLLRRGSSGWRTALRIWADGIAKGGLSQHLSGSTDRLRVHPAGTLARHAAGELALLEPPAEGESWRVRPSRSDPLLSDVPFAVPALVELRCDGRPVTQALWPGGEAVRSEIGVFEIEGPGTLVLIGTGSGPFRPDPLVVAVPVSWKVTPDGAGATVGILDGTVDDRQLWKVTGAARVHSLVGDVYRVAAGQSGAHRDRLVLQGERPSGLESDEPEVELFSGFAMPRVHEGHHERQPTPGEIDWRPVGERAWRPIGSARTARGLIDIAWRTPGDGFVRDRARAFLLPPGAALEQRREQGAVIYTLSNFGAASLRSGDENLVLEDHDDEIVARFKGRQARLVRLKLSIRGGRDLSVSAPFPQRSGLARWSGTLISPNVGSASQRLSLRQLADCVAFSPGPQVLHARLLDGARRPLEGGQLRWTFRDELPLRGVTDDLTALLSPFADIDVWAELSFGGGGECWSVGRFEACLTLNGHDIGILDGVPHGEVARIYGRPMHDLSHERGLAEVTLSDRLNRRAPSLPDNLPGAWLVYLRSDDHVISRPLVAPFSPEPRLPLTGLTAAAMIADRAKREHATLARLAEVASGAAGAHADVGSVVALCASLRGLPPASLDLLRFLARCPGAAARVALAAGSTGDAERTAVLALSDALPFAWCMIPRACWARAAELECESLELTYEPLLGVAAGDVARKVVAASAEKLVIAEPLLHWPLSAAQLVPFPKQGARSLKDAAMDHIRRYGDRVEEGNSTRSVFRTAKPHGMPLSFEQDFHPVHVETLDAPCAAAAVAAGAPALGEAAVRRIKIAARADPIYFVEGFNAYFLEAMRA